MIRMGGKASGRAVQRTVLDDRKSLANPEELLCFFYSAVGTV